MLPTWEQRRKVLARDPLASVDGFHILSLLLLKHLFGVNVCPNCPTCTASRYPCIDRAGSSATLTGGVFGRVDATYISVEAQKSTGSLHAHCQVFVQCMHQHTPLTEIFQLVEERLDALRAEYLQYNAHVVHSVYSGQTKEAIDAGIAAAESTWPEHAVDKTMIAYLHYQRVRALYKCDKTEAAEWQKTYLQEDVVALQYLKQHHYHPFDPATGGTETVGGMSEARPPRGM